MKIHSLRFRLSLTNGVVLAVAFLCVGYARYATIAYRLSMRFDRDLVGDATFLSSRLVVTPGSYALHSDGLTAYDTFNLQQVLAYSVITDRQGKVVNPDMCSRYVREMLQQGALSELLQMRGGTVETAAADGTRFRFVSLPVGADLDSPYVVHVGRDAQSLEGVLGQYREMYLLSLPLLLVVSVAVGWFLAGRALKPFDDLAHAVEQITSKNLSIPILSHYREEEVQKLVDAFNLVVTRLDGSFRQMSRFNADVAHELRTPLAVLQGETEIALQSPGLPDEITAVLCSNLEELDRLGRIVKDLLTLAEADAGTQVIAEQEIRLAPLMRDLVEQMRLLAADRSIEINIDRIDEAVMLGDELWIRRALLNLLDNAIKYSKIGGRVDVQVQSLGASVRVAVRDQGIGIAPEDLPRIFDRLYRADPARSRSTGGAGLGLAFVKWIVEAHHGRIAVDSQPDRDTLFTLEFPQVARTATGTGT